MNFMKFLWRNIYFLKEFQYKRSLSANYKMRYGSFKFLLSDVRIRFEICKRLNYLDLMWRLKDLNNMRFGLVLFGSVNDTEALVFGYLVFTRFDRPLVVGMYFFSKQTLRTPWVENHPMKALIQAIIVSGAPLLSV